MKINQVSIERKNLNLEEITVSVLVYRVTLLKGYNSIFLWSLFITVWSYSLSRFAKAQAIFVYDDIIAKQRVEDCKYLSTDFDPCVIDWRNGNWFVYGNRNWKFTVNSSSLVETYCMVHLILTMLNPSTFSVSIEYFFIKSLYRTVTQNTESLLISQCFSYFDLILVLYHWSHRFE